MSVFDETRSEQSLSFIGCQGRQIRKFKEVSGVCGESVVSLRTIKRWVARFSRNDISVEDKQRTGRPREENETRVIEEKLENDPCMSAREIGRILGNDKNKVVDILRNQLQMSKVWVRWIPQQ